MTFTDPLFLWLILPAVALFALFAATERRPRPAYCRWMSPVVRSVVAACVLLVLAGPVRFLPPPDVPVGPPTPTGDRDEVVYVDGRHWHDAAAVRDLLSTLPAADDAIWIRTPDGRMIAGDDPERDSAWPFASADGVAVAAPPSLHWLSADIEAMRHQLSPNGARRLHIVGDHPPNDRQRDVLASHRIGFEFHPAPGMARLPEPVLAGIETNVDQPEADFPVRTSCRAFGPLAGAQWRIAVDGTPGAWRDVPIETGTGGNSARLVADPLSLPAGAHGITFELRTADGHTVVAHRGLVMREPPHWAILPDRGAAGAAGTAWLQQLAGQAGLSVESTPQLPDDLFERSGVIVPLIRLIRMRDTDLARLRRYVREGGGLIVPCLTPTAIPADAVERLGTLLPVQVGPLVDDPGGRAGVNPEDLPEDLARMAIVFLVDNSASMLASVGTATRAQYVRAAVIAAIDGIKDTDKVTVTFFDEAVRGSLGPYTATPENRELLKQEVRDFPQPDHRTSIVAACNEARRVLAHEHAAIRHVVLLSDGEDTMSEMADFRRLGQRFRDAGISCSCIGIGEFDPQTLREVYTPGSGQLHFAQSGAGADYYRQKIPELFFREVQRAQLRGDQAMPPPDADPQSRQAGRLIVGKEIPAVTYARIVDDFPPVLRHMQLRARPGALTVLEVQLDPRVAAAEGRPNPWSPLLVTWRVGLGEVAAFGSGLDPENIPDWVDWEQSSLFFGSWLRALSHPQPGDHTARELAWTHRPDGITLSGRIAAVSTDARQLPTASKLEAVLTGRLSDEVPPARVVDAADLQLEKRDGSFRVHLPAAVAQHYSALRLQLTGLPGRATPTLVGIDPIPPGPATGSGGVAWWTREPVEPVTVEAPAAAEPVGDGGPDGDNEPADDGRPPIPIPLTGLTTVLLLIAASLIPIDVFLRR